MLPYGRQSISDEDVQAVLAVLQSDWLTTGPVVKEFEDALSGLTGGHGVVSCSSGTAALHIAYHALEVGPESDVITSPMTFVATASSASVLGARVHFADVDAYTGNINPESVASLVTSRTRVIAAVDYSGHPCDYDRLSTIAEQAGAALLADAAHSFGGSYRGRPVGDLADVTVLSFFPTKNITTGEGGAVVAKDQATLKRAAEFHNIGLVREPDRFLVHGEGPWHQEVHEFGLNYRLSDIASALGLSQLQRLGSFRKRRSRIVERYNAAFSSLDGIRTPTQAEDVSPMWHLYSVRILGGRRQVVYESMRAAGIGVQVNYMPVYWHPAYERLGYRRGMCPNAEHFYSQELSLPLHPSMTDSEVDRVCEALERALRR